MVTRWSKVCNPRPPVSRSAKCLRAAPRMVLYRPIGWPTTNSRQSSNVCRIRSPPGTSPTPVWPALSRRITTFRVKNGACAPERLSNMSSWPATGTTSISVTFGDDGQLDWMVIEILYSAPGETYLDFGPEALLSVSVYKISPSRRPTPHRAAAAARPSVYRPAHENPAPASRD